MKVVGDYYGDGFARVEQLIPAEVGRAFLLQLQGDIARSSVPMRGFVRDATILKRPALEIYSPQHKHMQGLHWGLTATMTALTGRTLIPTYAYFRAYQQGDVLWVHSDRYACEHSLTLTLAYSDGVVWPFEIARERLVRTKPVADDFEEDAYASIEMQPGDAVLYQGVYHRHGRITPAPNAWSAHLFLHWVDEAGHFKDEAFDRQRPEGEPNFALPST